ncbi:hypothetical protein QT716_11570 [Sporosarcina aquimarina]|uniref:EpsG family protein n=2 Tax=Sporosarcina aquimarina TaxID=114975 RepID=A0ABU4G134_9BACL|nr:hypothetical protein [Sporosarcina aquimarina]
MSFSKLWGEMMQSYAPLNLLYMHLIGKTNIDGLLPAITSFIFYSNIFYVFKRSVFHFNVRTSDASLVLFFFMSLGVLIEVISGIRTMLSFSFIAVVIYKEMVEGKSVYRHAFWYIAASLIHPAGLVLTGIRFSYYVFEKSKTNYERLTKILFILITVAGILVFGRLYLLESYDKAVFYLLEDKFSYFWEYVIGIISLLFVMYILRLVSKSNRLQGGFESQRNLIGFSKYLSILLIIFSIEYNIFHRFVIFLSIMAIPLMLSLFAKQNQTNIVRGNFRRFVFYLSCLLLLLACSRGNLTSLKFFEF